jgi:AraC-like DNA-binding protein
VRNASGKKKAKLIETTAFILLHCVKTKSVSARLMQIHNWENLAGLAMYRASELARICGANQRTLERFFRARFGRPPQQWLDQARQAQVEVLLRGEKQIKEIAFIAGYKQPSHMARHFRLNHGLSPSAWRSQLG